MYSLKTYICLKRLLIEESVQNVREKNVYCVHYERRATMFLTVKT